MQLPFTREQFFDLFAAYSEALWPAVAALWTVSAAIVVLRLSVRHEHDRWVSALLAVHWLWSAVAYHVAFFTRINPAAWLFAALFLVQAILFLRVGVVQRRLSFAPWGSAWASLAWGLIAYSLAYPAINALEHRSLLRIPTFGVPCPTTIFTAGVLMLATPRCWSLSVVPVIWSAIGGSAAFLLGVNADIALPIAGVALAIFSLWRSTPKQLPVTDNNHEDHEDREGHKNKLGENFVIFVTAGRPSSRPRLTPLGAVGSWPLWRPPTRPIAYCPSRYGGARLSSCQ